MTCIYEPRTTPTCTVQEPLTAEIAEDAEKTPQGLCAFCELGGEKLLDINSADERADLHAAGVHISAIAPVDPKTQ